MTKLTELSDVGVNQTLLDQRPPVLSPQLPPGAAYNKVLYYNDVTKVWTFAVRYALLVLKRRLVTASRILAPSINSSVQWGELFSIDSAETGYYVRSNAGTTAGAYDGNNTIIEFAGPGAFVSRNGTQVVEAKKAVANDFGVGGKLTAITSFKAFGGVVDCGEYFEESVECPAGETGIACNVISPPGIPLVTEVNPYNVSLYWGASSAGDIKTYIVDMAVIGPYGGTISSIITNSEALNAENAATASLDSLLPWAAVINEDTTAAQITGLRPGFAYTFRVTVLTKSGKIRRSTDNAYSEFFDVTHSVAGWGASAPIFYILPGTPRKLGRWVSTTVLRDPTSGAETGRISRYRLIGYVAVVLAYAPQSALP
jgi:hypothetical protein